MIATADRRAAPRVRIIDADPALAGLLEQWLGELPCRIASEGAADLVIVDIPFPRQGKAEVLRRLAREHPTAPILALSSSFFAGIETNGAVARWLGVAAALPKPVTQAALTDAVRRLLYRA
jgi:DNA-binding NarL/FixJ family response regulator